MPLSESDRFSRLKTARAHEVATANKPSSVVRIGDRDPQTGLHKTLDACGNEALNGEKIFSSQHLSGDIVRATRAGGSGLVQLDSINARSPVQERSILGDNCPGYFNGQIFSCEEEKKKKPIISESEWSCFEIIDLGNQIFQLKTTSQQSNPRLEYQTRSGFSKSITDTFDFQAAYLVLNRGAARKSLDFTFLIDGREVSHRISMRLRINLGAQTTGSPQLLVIYQIGTNPQVRYEETIPELDSSNYVNLNLDFQLGVLAVRINSFLRYTTTQVLPPEFTEVISASAVFLSSSEPSPEVFQLKEPGWFGNNPLLVTCTPPLP